MDLGGIVICGGQRFYVRGLDPVGIHPRYLYLENARTGERVSVAFEQHPQAQGTSRGRIRLVRESVYDPQRAAIQLEEQEN